MMNLRLTILLLLWLMCALKINGQSYYLNGNASASGNDCYTITPDQGFQNGTVWYGDQLDLSQSFELEFFMNFGNADDNGADGMVFVLQTIGTGAIGSVGSGMGFQGFIPSFGIEFDTYSNNAQSDPAGNQNDPLSDHVAFLQNGNVNHSNANNLAGPVQASAVSQNIEDGQDHAVRITWDPATNSLVLFFDCEQRLSATVNLLSIFNTSQVYFGFTGSTGYYHNTQRVCLQENIIPSPTQTSICPGTSAVLSAGGNPNAVYQWTPAYGLSSTSAQNPSASPDISTTYTVTYDDLCGVQRQETFEVIVLPPPDVDAGGDVSFCDGDSNTLQAVSSGVVSYQWSTPDGQIVSGANSPYAIINDAGTYTVTVTDANGCEASDAAEANLLPLPEPGLGGDVFVCPGETTVLSISDSYDSVLWSTGETTNDITASPGSYTVQVTQNGCSASDAIYVVEIQVPEIDLGPDVRFCTGETALLSAGTIVSWSTGDISDVIQISEPGIYTAEVNVQGCTDADEIEVTVDQYLPVSLGDDLTLCPGQTVEITAQSPGTWNTGHYGNTLGVSVPGTYSIAVVNGTCTSGESVDVIGLHMPEVFLGDDFTICESQRGVINAFHEYNDSYLWSTGETEDHIEVSDAGVYSVEVANVCGSASDTITVEQEDCNYFLYIPNAFSPNNDGINDYWKVYASNISSIEISVFNRWGERIFFSDNTQDVWQGDYRNGGYYVENEVYVYFVRFTSGTMDAQEKTGSILLLR